jgi:polysaccharide export outer membrane protein
VLGAVTSPGLRQLEGTKTLVEILSMAGGPTADAGPVVKLTRRKDQGTIPIPGAVDHADAGFSVAEIPLKSLMNSTAPATNVVIRPNDVVSVPRAEVVYVVGEVGRAGAVPLSTGKSLSVIEALSAVGGALRTAAPGGARIIRVSSGSEKRTEVQVDLPKIMHGKSDDLPLFAGDILVVPDSKGKRATTRALEAALQAGLIIGTYGVIR